MHPQMLCQVKGYMRVQAAEVGRQGWLGSLQPISLLLRMAGLKGLISNMSAVMRVANSILDALAVYIFMAALTCSLDLQLHGQALFSRTGDTASRVPA
jgi:hypothetical protein